MRFLSKSLATFLLLSAGVIEIEAQESVEGLKKTREVFLVKDVPQTLTFEYEIGEIAVGAPDIVSVVADRPRRRVVLSPLREGDTALLVFDTFGKQRDNIQITVTSTDLDQFVKDLRFLLRDIEGLQYKRVGRKVVIEGEVFLKADLDRISRVTEGNGEFIVNLVSLSQDTQRILARRIKDEINISGVEVSPVKDKIVLRGEVASEDESKRAEKIAGIYAAEGNIVNALSVNPKKAAARAGRIIQVTAHLVEVDKSFLRNFSFNFAPTADVTFAYNYDNQSGFRPAFFATISRFLPSLVTAKALGVARVFENPTVSVKSGEAANVTMGAELILGTRDPDSGRTVYSPDNRKNIGVTFNVTPAVDDRDFIDLQVEVEASKLALGTTESAILVRKSSVRTKHYVRSGETVAIGGALRSAFSEVRDAPPSTFDFAPRGAEGPALQSSFGNIFQIFKSRSNTADKTMFIVFLTPEVLGSARDSSQELRDQMNLQSVQPRGVGEGLE